MAQESHIAEKIKKTYKQIDIVFGTFALGSVPELVYKVISEKKRVVDISEEHMPLPEGGTVIRESSFKASVPIMYGCNNFCTYCIVPYVRGRERSRKHEDILNEINDLIKKGYKEIMLLGQNVNSYGKDIEGEYDFSDLLHEINTLDGDFIVRFMSSHPKDATNKLIDTIIECDKIAKHLHLPVQSGSNRILEAMNRKYTKEDYLKIVEYARSKMPDFSFSSDLIIGFPNETDDDYRETLDMVRKVRFDNIFSFIYSPRKGTKAAEMEDLTSDTEKIARINNLLSIQREVAGENYKRFIGRTLTVLADSKGKKYGFLTGKSSEFIIVEFEAPEELIGSFVNVKITESRYWELVGKIK